MKKTLTNVLLSIILLFAFATSAYCIEFVDAASAPTTAGTDVTLISATGPAGVSKTVVFLALVNTGAVTVYYGLGVAGASVGNTPGTDAGLASGDSISFLLPMSGVKSVGFRTSSGTGAVEVHAVIQ